MSHRIYDIQAIKYEYIEVGEYYYEYADYVSGISEDIAKMSAEVEVILF